MTSPNTSAHRRKWPTIWKLRSRKAYGDATSIAKALGDIARANGMSRVTCDAELSRESLYEALSGERNPNLSTVLRVVDALGLKLRAEAVLDSDADLQSTSVQR